MEGTISLRKMQPISLKKGLKVGDEIRIGMGWTKCRWSAPVDLDVSLFMLKNNRCDDIVFYNKLKDDSGAVVHSPDDREGEVDASIDAEYIDIDFRRIPKRIDRMVIVVTIDESKVKNQTFNTIDEAEVRVYDGQQSADKEVVARFNLVEDYSNYKAFKAVEFYKKGEEWFINRIQEGKNCDLLAFCEEYGVDVED